jgi:hypothetical protein
LAGVAGSIGLGSPGEDVFAAIETPDDYDVKQARTVAYVLSRTISVWHYQKRSAVRNTFA